MTCRYHEAEQEALTTAGDRLSGLRKRLAPLSWLYQVAASIYDGAYRRGVFRQARLPVPVISVGNITVGGTGKTPLVEYLAGWLSGEGIQVVILSRGYKAPTTEGSDSDEANVLGRNLPHVPHVTGRNRYLSGLSALARFGADVFVLDDGFQHRPLYRDLDIVAINSLLPFGHERLLPAGLLREPLSALKRAHIAVITHANFADQDRLEAIESKLRAVNGKLLIARAFHKPVSLGALRAGSSQPLEWLQGKRVLGFCGIGSPEGFKKTLDDLGADLVSFHTYPDHHYYSRHDVAQLAVGARQEEVEAVLTTQKDAVRLPSVIGLFDMPVLALKISCAFLTNEQELRKRVMQVIPKRQED